MLSESKAYSRGIGHPEYDRRPPATTMAGVAVEASDSQDNTSLFPPLSMATTGISSNWCWGTLCCISVLVTTRTNMLGSEGARDCVNPASVGKQVSQQQKAVSHGISLHRAWLCWCFSAC